MLLLEITGQPFNKAERRRELQRILHDRSEGAVERKHQNISAVLIQVGYPYVDGYKPLGNYQALLLDVVLERISTLPQLAAEVASTVDARVDVPTVDDILAVLVPAPPRPEHRYAAERERLAPPTGRKVNFLAREAANTLLGRAGEQFVLNFERAKLIASGKESLAASVQHVASTNDTAGFDILSFEADGQDRLIEVKTTQFGVFTPFYVSRNELGVSTARECSYHLYRVFGFRKRPQMFIKAGRLDQSFLLDPTVYEATLS